mmetsp:Transcript_3877/g.6592  ORF Transcript_3877/g.6592 Transcript_3877/m.6592 type:complete len:199 (+) Transcript_3877:142-738(+)
MLNSEDRSERLVSRRKNNLRGYFMQTMDLSEVNKKIEEKKRPPPDSKHNDSESISKGQTIQKPRRQNTHQMGLGGQHHSSFMPQVASGEHRRMSINEMNPQLFNQNSQTRKRNMSIVQSKFLSIQQRMSLKNLFVQHHLVPKAEREDDEISQNSLVTNKTIKSKNIDSHRIRSNSKHDNSVKMSSLGAKKDEEHPLTV